MQDLRALLKKMPLVAVLRGIQPTEALAIGEVLVKAGFLCLEVPMNSPDALQSIEILAKAFGDKVLVGAGTVLTTQDVTAIAACGGQIIIMPHCDVEVIQAAKAAGLICVPGVITPTEAFAALKAGADAIKFFPAEAFSLKAIKAMRAVLPKDTLVIPTGGVTSDNLLDLFSQGADGLGLGASLYSPNDTPEQVQAKAEILMAVMQKKCAN